MYNRLFIIDVETSGCQGSCSHDPRNQVIQLAAYNLGSGESFNKLLLGVDSIPPESEECHGINLKKLTKEGAPVKQVEEEFLQWVDKHRLRADEEDEEEGGPKPLLFLAHNAPFDLTALMGVFQWKELPQGWGFVDTLEMVKQWFPDIGEQIWPRDSPYNLGNLYRWFFCMEMQNQHDAMGDVLGLRRLVEEILKPTIFKYQTPQQKDQQLDFSELLALRTIPRVRQSRDEPLVQLSGFTEYNLEILCEVLNRELPEEFKTSPNYINANHLILLGAGRLKARGEEVTGDSWVKVLEEVERFIRGLENVRYKKPLFPGDNKPLRVLSVCAQLLPWELHQLGFPFCRVEPLAFLPLELDQEECNFLQEEAGVGTLHQLLQGWIYAEDRKGFLERLNMGQGNICTEFDELKKWGS